MADTIVDNRLIINKLTKAQYDALEEKNENELYLIPDIVDSTPTQNSENYVTSGGVYTALAAKANAADMKFTNGSGANADKVTIQLKSGTTSTVLRTHQDITGKEDKMTIEAIASPGATLTAEVGKYYTMSNVGTLMITLPAGSGTKTQTIVFFISTASTTDVDFTSTSTVYKSKGFDIAADSTYEINALWNGVAWVIGQFEVEIPSNS